MDYRHLEERAGRAMVIEQLFGQEGEVSDGVARVRGPHGDASAARRRLRAVGTAYFEFARDEPGLFATAFAVPRQHGYGAVSDEPGDGRLPLDQLRTVLDELVDAGVLDRRRREGIEYPIWATVHGLAVLTGQGPLRAMPEASRRHLEELTLGFIDGALE